MQLDALVRFLNSKYSLDLKESDLRTKLYDFRLAGFKDPISREEEEEVEALLLESQRSPVLRMAETADLCPRCQSKMVEAYLVGGEKAVVCPACRVVDLV